MTRVQIAKPGSIFGGALLTAGCCIGAGMLALPILAGLSGFFPSLFAFVIVACFMTSTGLLIIEVIGWYEKPVHYLTLVGDLLGPIGRGICWILYAFLFYSLLIAYTVLSGNHVSMMFSSALKVEIPPSVGSLFFILLFGWLVYMGTALVDHFNRGLMYLKILAYLGLIVIGMEFIHPSQLFYTDTPLLFASLPILVISFGFHNMIPTLSKYLGGDQRRLIITVVFAVLFVFIVYILWQAIALGVLPVHGSDGIVESYKKNYDAAQSIQLFTHSYRLGLFAAALAFFAILTSFLAQSLSLVHFLSDGLGVKHNRRENIWICILTLAPPWILSCVFPNVFFAALDFAGGFCAVIIFGVIPVLMVWRGRYRLHKGGEPLLKGGKGALVLILLFALLILFYQVSIMFGWDFFPHINKNG